MPTASSIAAVRRSASPGGTPARSSGSRTLRATVRCGSRWKAWKTKPIASRRSSVRAVSSRRVISLLPTTISPASGVSRPAIRLSSVDLPTPDSPMIATNSPRATSRSSSRSTVCARTPPYDFVTPRSLSTRPMLACPAKIQGNTKRGVNDVFALRARAVCRHRDRCVLWRNPRANLSDAPDTVDRSVLAGRGRRCARAHTRRQAHGRAGPAGGDRQPPRRRLRDRRGSGGTCGAGWLHALHDQQYALRDRRASPEARLRSAERLHGHHAGDQRAERADRASVAAGEEREGADRAREGAAGRDQLRLVR